MAIEMVRVPSETPNISNNDDFVGLRYAYGNQNGYVIGKGQECSYSVVGSTFKINSGRLVLQGVEVDIDANGVEITIDNVATTRYYTVYLQVNLATNEAKILSEYGTDTYPEIASGDDLTANTNGIAKMELYHFTAINGVVGTTQKVVDKIEYVGDMTVKNATNAIANSDGSYSGFNQNANNILYANTSEIVEKRVLIWEGVLGDNADGTSSTTLEVTIPHKFNGIYEIKFRGIKGNDMHFQKMKLLTRDDTLSTWYTLSFIEAGTDVINVNACIIELIRVDDTNTKIKISDPSMFQGGYTSSTVKYYQASYPTISKIYKIITTE